MSDTRFTVSTEATTERPIDLVRQHFADLDHVIRDGIYDGMALQWAAGRATGERRVRQEWRLLGRPQVDTFVVEDGADDAIVRRFVDGPARGMVQTVAFASEGVSRTRVVASATVPAAGLRWAIGPLYRLAVRKSLERMVGCHLRDLEGGGYEPGRARGQVEAALVALGPVVARAQALPRDHERVALVTPLLEAACVTAIADDDADDAERDTIRAVVHRLGVAMLDDDAVEALMASSIDRTRAEGIERRCDELGRELRELDLAEPGLSVAALVAQVSNGIDHSELAVLQRLARAAGISDEALATLIERVDKALSGERV